ncbi:MAG: hypothetical protein HC788_05205, partial [Sphingopyxis sp.]|nr:hypothetical protein [Sphingopyxis sp.]
ATSRAINVRKMTITGTMRGIVVRQSQGVGLYQNKLTGLRSDGVNIAESQRVVVEGNSCANFNPIAALYDADGTKIVDGDHPDCVQAWSRSTSAPTADVVIRGNSMTGHMQGIFFGNHIRDGVGDGGFDRIVVENNYMNISRPNGIYMTDARTVRIVNNEVQTIPGSTMKAGTYVVRSNIKSIRNINIIACGNIVGAQPTSFGTQPC